MFVDNLEINDNYKIHIHIHIFRAMKIVNFIFFFVANLMKNIYLSEIFTLYWFSEMLLKNLNIQVGIYFVVTLNLCSRKFSKVFCYVYNCWRFFSFCFIHCIFLSTVKPRISVISFPSPPTITRGQNIKLLCNETSDKNENIDTFLWQHDGKLLANNTNILSFENADLAVSGEYICTAKNVAGKDSAGLKIIVSCKYA